MHFTLQVFILSYHLTLLDCTVLSCVSRQQQLAPFQASQMSTHWHYSRFFAISQFDTSLPELWHTSVCPPTKGTYTSHCKQPLSTHPMCHFSHEKQPDNTKDAAKEHQLDVASQTGIGCVGRKEKKKRSFCSLRDALLSPVSNITRVTHKMLWTLHWTSPNLPRVTKILHT